MALSKFASSAKIQVRVKAKDQTRKQYEDKIKTNLTHLIKQKRNLKGETDLNITFKMLHNRRPFFY